ncbi:MAG: PIN domain-containing protein [Pyrinomonadaceae bacterium]
MDIVLDTNILRGDPLLRSVEFDVLVDFVRKTDSRIRMPTIVFDEVIAVYTRELTKRVADFEKADRSLKGFVFDYKSVRATVSIEEVVRYKRRLLERLGIKESDLVELKGTYLQEVVNRAIHRRPPCSEKGEEIRDAIIWLSALDVADESYDSAVSFISNNTRQFALDNNLHPRLLSEADDRGLIIHYYKSLIEFVEAQTTPSEAYTREWFLSQIDVEAVLTAADSIIAKDAEWSIDWKLREEVSHRENASSTGYFNRQTNEIALDKYLVYVMSDGSLRGLAIFIGEIEVECEYQYEVEQEVEEEDWNPFLDQPSRTFIRRTSDWLTDYIYVYPVVEIFVGFTVRDSELCEWSVQNV